MRLQQAEVHPNQHLLHMKKYLSSINVSLNVCFYTVLGNRASSTSLAK